MSPAIAKRAPPQARLQIRSSVGTRKLKAHTGIVLLLESPSVLKLEPGLLVSPGVCADEDTSDHRLHLPHRPVS